MDWVSTSPDGTPDLVIEQADQAARIRRALASLPRALAQVLLLHYLEGRSYAEIAAALDVPVSTVRGRLATSRTRLSQELVAAGAATSRMRRGVTPDALSAATPGGAQASQRKDLPMPTTALPAVEPAAPPLVPVAIESIETIERTPTRDNVTQWLQQLWPTPRHAEEDAMRPDLTPVADQLAAALRERDLTVPSQSRGVHLKEVDGERRLWLTVGVAEADAMALVLRHQSTPRPLTHELTGHLLAAVGQRVTRAVITRMEENTFFATVTIQGLRGRPRAVDARPPDAICLALRAGVPIYVAESLLVRAGPGFVRPDPQSSDATARIAAAVTPAGERALAAMCREAADLGHRYLGTEHLLLGLLIAGGAAATVLAEHGVSADRVRRGIAFIVGRARVLVGEPFHPEPNLQPGLATPRLEALFERALDYASSRGRPHVTTPMLLLALVDDPSSLATGILQSIAPNLANLADAARATLDSDDPDE